MQPKLDLSLASRMRLLAVGLLTTGIDIALFRLLYQQPGSLAAAHISSFLAASAMGYLLISLWPLHGTADKTRLDYFKPAHLLTFAAITLLLLFLRGGLLASLLEVAALPPAIAIFTGALFSSVLFYAACLYLISSGRADSQPGATGSNSFILAIIVYAILLRLFYLGVPDLIFEEAYYWNYARHLDIGYLDHPLMVAWIIRLFISFFGDTEFAVRFGAFSCWFVTAYFSFRLTCEILNKASAQRALLIVAVLPAYFSFGWFMSPDAPLTASWAMAIYFAHQALVRDERKAWLGLGIAIGLGTISKYTIVLLATAVVLFVLANRDSRKWLRRPEPYVAAVLACLLFSPVVIWNMQHDWLSFTFQSQGRVTSGYSFSLPRFIGNLVILLTPNGLLSVAAILFYRRAILSGAQTGNGKPGGSLKRSYFLLLWLTLFPAAVFAALSLFRASKLNWTGPVWLGLAPFMALLLPQKPDLSAPKLLYWCQRAWPATLLVLLLAYGGALHYLGLGLPKVPYPQNVHLMGWQDFGRDIELLVTRLERETGEKILVVGMDRNKTASELAFYRAKYINSLDRKPDRDPSLETAGEHLFGGGSLMYALWFPVEDQNGKTMLLVGEKRDDLSSDRVLSRVTVAQEVKEIKIWRNGKQTGQYYYRLIQGYQSQPAGKQP